MVNFTAHLHFFIQYFLNVKYVVIQGINCLRPYDLFLIVLNDIEIPILVGRALERRAPERKAILPERTRSATPNSLSERNSERNSETTGAQARAQFQNLRSKLT